MWQGVGGPPVPAHVGGGPEEDPGVRVAVCEGDKRHAAAHSPPAAAAAQDERLPAHGGHLPRPGAQNSLTSL